MVQTILAERTRDWVDFYETLFGFSVLPQGRYFGVLPNGTLLESPCHKFYLQLIEPPPESGGPLGGRAWSAWASARATCRRRCAR